MEKQLFDFVGRDDVDTLVNQYYNVSLNRDIGNFKKGNTFDVAVLNYQEGVLILQCDGDEWIYPLTLHIGDRIHAIKNNS